MVENPLGAQCHLVLWGGTIVPQPTLSSACSNLLSPQEPGRGRPGAAQGSRPTQIAYISAGLPTL